MANESTKERAIAFYRKKINELPPTGTAWGWMEVVSLLTEFGKSERDAALEMAPSPAAGMDVASAIVNSFEDYLKQHPKSLQSARLIWLELEIRRHLQVSTGTGEEEAIKLLKRGILAMTGKARIGWANDVRNYLAAASASGDGWVSTGAELAQLAAVESAQGEISAQCLTEKDDCLEWNGAKCEEILRALIQQPESFMSHNARLQRKPDIGDGWVSTSERLPDNQQKVNFIVKSGEFAGEVLGGKFVDMGQGASYFSTPGVAFSATFWRPLPPGPGGEK